MQLGLPARCPFTLFLGEGSPTKIEYRKRGTLILTSLLEDLDSLEDAVKQFKLCPASLLAVS